LRIRLVDLLQEAQMLLHFPLRQHLLFLFLCDLHLQQQTSAHDADLRHALPRLHHLRPHSLPHGAIKRHGSRLCFSFGVRR
jgi:hypothetical protein